MVFVECLNCVQYGVISDCEFFVCAQLLMDVARHKNSVPLPLIKPFTGPKLPPDRYCLTAPNYRLKSQNKLSFGIARLFHSFLWCHNKCDMWDWLVVGLQCFLVQIILHEAVTFQNYECKHQPIAVAIFFANLNRLQRRFCILSQPLRFV